MKKLITLSLLLVAPAVWTQEATVPKVEYCYEEPKQYTEKWQRFITDNLPIALKLQQDFGIDPIFTLAQSALETGYGKHTPGNMFFGIKDHDGATNGNEQLLKTHEFFATPTREFRRAQVLRIDSIGPNLYRYQIRDYFRKYNTPAESFQHYAEYLSKRLKGEVCCDALQMAEKMARINYATSTKYTSSLKVAIKKIKNFIEEENLTSYGRYQIKAQIPQVLPV